MATQEQHRVEPKTCISCDQAIGPGDGYHRICDRGWAHNHCPSRPNPNPPSPPFPVEGLTTTTRPAKPGEAERLEIEANVLRQAFPPPRPEPTPFERMEDAEAEMVFGTLQEGQPRVDPARAALMCSGPREPSAICPICLEPIGMQMAHAFGFIDRYGNEHNRSAHLACADREKAASTKIAHVPQPVVRGNLTPMGKLQVAADLIIAALGEDPSRPDLQETRNRFARAWLEIAVPGEPPKCTTFESAQTNQMVVISGIHAWTVCEHHLLPFKVVATVGYIPDGRILGLSKFARIVRHQAHRLQVQERLAQGIAQHVQEATGSEDVAVFLMGRHLCMEMRGARAEATTKTSELRGRFFTNSTTRAEFLSLATTDEQAL